jgi:hypothetical protein
MRRNRRRTMRRNIRRRRRRNRRRRRRRRNRRRNRRRRRRRRRIEEEIQEEEIEEEEEEIEVLQDIQIEFFLYRTSHCVIELKDSNKHICFQSKTTILYYLTLTTCFGHQTVIRPSLK